MDESVLYFAKMIPDHLFKNVKKNINNSVIFGGFISIDVKESIER